MRDWVLVQRPCDHEIGKFFDRRVGDADVRDFLSGAKDNGAIGNFHDLVELMRDNNDAFSGSGQFFDCL